MSNLAPHGDIKGHAWWPETDTSNKRHVWHCTCKHTIVQAFGAPVPDELISHPQEHGQLRGHDWEPILHQRDELEEDLTLCKLSWSAQPALGVEPLPCRECIRERQRRRGVGRYAES